MYIVEKSFFPLLFDKKDMYTFKNKIRYYNEQLNKKQKRKFTVNFVFNFYIMPPLNIVFLISLSTKYI